MKKDEKMKPDNKRGFPGILLLFVVGLIVVLAFQNLSETKSANVAFSHQLEHLVNLDLLDTDHNIKTALNNDSLVSFKGVFREKLTEKSRDRYRYLSLLNSHHELLGEQERLLGELNQLQKGVNEAGGHFLAVTGIRIPRGGFEVLPRGYDSDGRSNSVVITNPGSSYHSATFMQLKHQYSELSTRRDITGLDSLGTELLGVIAELRSSKIGIGQENLKDTLRTAQVDAERAVSREVGVEEKYAALTESMKLVDQVVTELVSENKGVRLFGLRSVGNYLEYLGMFETVSGDYAKNVAQLVKSRAKVATVIWFYNNQSISSRALEKKGAEEFRQWYGSTEQEWENYQTNRGLAFRAPDQPRNEVLEKTFRSEEPAPNYFNYIFTFLPIILIGMLLYFVFSRQMKGGGGNSAMNFGKSPAKLLNKSTQSITFDDVAGIDEAKEELEEVVDFLRDPERFKTLGAKIPKGVLLIGSPGTGKTLVAKAVAGEAGVPFYSISGSDFVEMFVGVGASRVRDLFEQARKSSPCIIFIDEIDAVGRHRGSGMGGGHDEREQTLNQLLVEIDGMDSDTGEGVIIIAATNRPDVLDPALLRPGRFDRSVSVDLPDMRGRLAILKVHSRKIKMDAAVDLRKIAALTTGQSGADLANIINEAALKAAKKRRPAVTHQDFLYAQEKVVFGKERPSLEMEEEDMKTTSFHEAGHAVLGLFLKSSDPVTKVTRTPRGRSLGATHFEPKKNRVNYKKSELLVQLIVLMGGRCAEEIINNDASSGAQMDIQMATNVARSMVCEWGMSDTVGMINYSDDSQKTLMAGFQERGYSDETATVLDNEIKKLVDNAYKTATDLLIEHKDKLDLMADMLMEFETLDKEDLDKIMDGTWDAAEKKSKLEAFEANEGRQPPPYPHRLTRKKNKLKDNPAT